MRTLHAAAVLALGLFLTRCAAAPQPSFLVRPDRVVETRPLPPDPSTEALPTGTDPADYTEPQEPGECLDAQGRPLPTAPRPCPARGGLLLSDARVIRASFYQIRYRELRIGYEADRGVWTAHRELYEGQLRRAEEHIRSLQPSWLERNALSLGLAGGFVLGAVTTIVLVSVLPPILNTVP